MSVFGLGRRCQNRMPPFLRHSEGSGSLARDPVVLLSDKVMPVFNLRHEPVWVRLYKSTLAVMGEYKQPPLEMFWTTQRQSVFWKDIYRFLGFIGIAKLQNRTSQPSGSDEYVDCHI